jgi:hypothetical protein
MCEPVIPLGFLVAAFLASAPSGDVTFRYWRPAVAGRRAVLVGFSRGYVPFCRNYTLVGRITMPVDNEERNGPIARCTLDRSLASIWPQLIRLST